MLIFHCPSGCANRTSRVGSFVFVRETRVAWRAYVSPAGRRANGF